MSATLVTTRLVHMECHKCHAAYGLTAEANQRFMDLGGHWWCPYCNTKTVYADTALSRERKAREKAEREAEWQRQRRESEARARVAAERSHRATKGHMTRLKKRVTAGVCPCCQRTFQDLARHMKGQHPEYANG